MQALAAADIQQVNDMWAGLGYYRRARFLLEGAQHVQMKLNGALPLTSEALQRIPGEIFCTVCHRGPLGIYRLLHVPMSCHHFGHGPGC